MPHVVTRTTKRVAHGKGTTVNGWLGMADGTALAGQTVTVLTAPDNGQGEFSEAAVAMTSANGSWTARLSAGPSRLVEATYGGSATLEPSTSSQVQVVVPAKVELISVSPARVAWGGTVRIVGKLDGGYLPPDGALVRLRLGQGSGVHDLRDSGTRDRQRPVRDDVHVRRRAPKRASDILVPDRLAADGGRLCLGSVRQPQG